MPSDRQIMRFVREFREGLLEERSSANWCFMVCAPLQGYMSAVGFLDAQLTEGEIEFPDFLSGHYWLTLPDGRIIDPTADQFSRPDGKQMPPIYFGKKPDWYKEVMPP